MYDNESTLKQRQRFDVVLVYPIMESYSLLIINKKLYYLQHTLKPFLLFRTRYLFYISML